MISIDRAQIAISEFNRCPKHSFCPDSSALLGLQIVYIALVFPLTLFLIYFGYQLADRGFDIMERGGYVKGWLIFVGAIMLACGSALLLPWFGYWAAFEGGALVLLR